MTKISFSDGFSDSFVPGAGVRQGDPLSPLLFNLVLDGYIRSLPGHIGIPWAGGLVNAAAYADDVLLFAETKAGLSELLLFSESYFESVGLAINLSKSFTISVVPSGREKKCKIANVTFKLASGSIPTLGVIDRFNYLGVCFEPSGRVFVDPSCQLAERLKRLSSAPLKPQQRLFALRVFLLPSFYHQLSLGRFRLGLLKRLDVLVRGAVRGWLRLPHDTPVAAFHADLADGGLGLSSFRLLAPVLRLNRLHRFMETYRSEDLLTMDRRLVKEQQRLFDAMRFEERVIQSLAEVRSFWQSSLYSSVDGVGLVKSRATPSQHSWVGDGSRLLTGRNFINAVKVRFNCIPARSRLYRGRGLVDRGCRAGCSAIETSNHILQVCYRSHGARIRRHNQVCRYVERSLVQQGYEVTSEPLYKLSTGNLKPDLVAVKDGKAIVVDAIVTGDSTSLEEARRSKILKYSGNDLLNVIKTTRDVDEVKVVACVLNWRGVWCPSSAKDLYNLRVLKKGDVRVISVRVLEGSYRIFEIWSTMTTRSRGVMNVAQPGVPRD